MKKDLSLSGINHATFWCKKILFFLPFFLSFLSMLQAQEMEIHPGVTTTCPAKFQDMHTRVAIPKASSKSFQERMQANATAEFQVTYGPGAEANPEAKAAFQFALDIWANELVSAVPIRVFADFANLGNGVLASAGPTYVVRNFTNAPKTEVLYPAALANSLAGEILDPSQDYDLRVNLGNGFNWYFGTDGNPGPGQFDFVTIALHEAGHGLGFINLDNYTPATGSATLRGFGAISTFSDFLVNGSGERLTDLPDPSVALGNELIGGDLFVDGTYAVAALGGTLPELYAPNPYQGGSSVSHWDEATFPAGDVNSLMTPQAGSAESIFDVGNITRGHFRDMGWVLNDGLSASPSSISEILLVNEIFVSDIVLTNRSEADINVSVTTSASFIDFPDGTEYIITALATDTLQARLNTAGLPKGIYNETITLTTQGRDDVTEITVSLTVFDGTEQPLISVNPVSFVESVEQFNILTQDLTISNTGDADLIYNISINDSITVNNFNERVKASNAFVSSNGFIAKATVPSTGVIGDSEYIQTGSNTISQLVTSLYATDFEDFSIGNILGQNGWGSRYEGNWIISDANAFDGALHFRGISDGLGGTRPSSIVAFSPSVVPGDEPFMVASAKINIQGNGTSWELIPQSPSQQSVVTRFRFNPDRSMEVLSGAGFVPVETTLPEGYFDFKIVLDKDNSQFSVFFDDQLVFRGQGFASVIEQMVFLSGMQEVGGTMDVDNLEITDGDPNGFFLSVDPISGTIPFGTSSTATVKFDARVLDSGVYEATINISSNDTTNSVIEIPVSLTVLQPPTISVTPDSLSVSIDVLTDLPPVKTETFTISNSGEIALDFDLTVGGTSISSNSSVTSAIDVASLDMRDYGVGNTTNPSIERDMNVNVDAFKRNTALLANSSVISDSIHYDQGATFPLGWTGSINSIAVTTAMRFDVDKDFTLKAIRNAFRTGEVDAPVIILEIYKGGSEPATGELISSQAITQASPDGAFVIEVLNRPIDFVTGESFWVIHRYPAGIFQPQGITLPQEGTSPRPDTYYNSFNGGETWNEYSSPFLENVFLIRALNGEGLDFMTLEPSSGIIAPGTSTDVTVTIDGAELPNGIYNTNIIINSNDPATPVETVLATTSISGQVSEISIPDEYLLYNNVFLGDQVEKTVSIANEGLETINISNISSNNADFTLSHENGIVKPGEFLDLVITFTPTSLGSINGIITINSDADNIETFEIVVNGVGVEPPIAILNPLEKQEALNAGESLLSEVTLRNDGNSPLIYSFPEFAVAAALARPDVKLNNTEYITFENSTPLSEQDADTRVGNPTLYSVGTDNEYGYTWIDSDEVGGPIYNFVDISESGTEVTPAVGRSGNIEINLSFPFFFYGNTYTKARIFADGFISFQESTGFAFLNEQIPDEDGVNNIIAAYWDNFDPRFFDGAIHYQGDDDRFIVQWTDMTESVVGNDAEKITFQLVLYLNGNIDIFYDDVETASFIDGGTVGIENSDATDGIQVAFNTPYIKDKLALRFIKPDKAVTSFITNVDRLSGVLPPGGSTTLSATLDAANLVEGTFYDELTVSSNAPDKSNSTTVFELNVTGFPEIQATPDSILFDSLFVGLETASSILIENVGTKALEITSITSTNADFIVSDTSAILLTETSLLIPVTFTPTSPGNITGEVVINSNDSFGNEALSIPVTGIGVDPPVVGVTPSSINLTLDEGDVVTESVMVSNTGGTTLTFNASYFTDSLTTVTISPMEGSVAPGEVMDIAVEVSTLGLETETGYTGEITLTSNDPFTPEVSVPVSLYVEELPEVVSFSLVDAVTDEIIGEMTDGYILDINEYGYNGFNIIANINDEELGSVVFDYNYQNRYKVRNNAPYTLGTERNGNYGAVDMPIGSNTLTATPYKERRGRGKAGISLSINFEVVDSSLPEIVGFTLVNADTDQTLEPIQDGDTVNLSSFDSNSFNIIANRGEQRVGSVVFDFNGIDRFRTENEAPYALGGRRGLNFNSLSLPLGTNTLTATPYVNSNGRGDEGQALTINFEVVEVSDSLNSTLIPLNAITGVDEPEIKVHPMPVTNMAYFSISNEDTERMQAYLMNMMGQIIYQPSDLPIDKNGQGIIDMTNLPKGTYLLVVSDFENALTTKSKILKR